MFDGELYDKVLGDRTDETSIIQAVMTAGGIPGSVIREAGNFVQGRPINGLRPSYLPVLDENGRQVEMILLGYTR